MPCTDGGYSQTQLDAIEKRKNQRAAKKAAAEKAEQKRLDDLTRMLCTLANSVEDGGFGMMTDLRLSKGEKDEILQWLKDHNIADEKRLAKEEAVAKKKEAAEDKKRTQSDLKKTAMKKLSAAERKALGL
tara:strand:- start:611 stop:1000 length:390 start_codon:yes stop_codon:yes gene_type:complete